MRKNKEENIKRKKKTSVFELGAIKNKVYRLGGGFMVICNVYPRFIVEKNFFSSNLV